MTGYERRDMRFVAIAKGFGGAALMLALVALASWRRSRSSVERVLLPAPARTCRRSRGSRPIRSRTSGACGRKRTPS